MAVRTLHDPSDNTWFITFTCYNWIPLFQLTNSYDLIYNWLKLIQDKHKLQTLAFVIMPNHVHLMLHSLTEGIELNKIISNGKRFMAYEFIKRLTDNKQINLLAQLNAGCTAKEKAKGQLHKVFESSFDAKHIYSDAFLNQKLDYIHNNPVSGKWNLCAELTDYPHSSAAYYLDGVVHPYINITDYRDVL